MKIADERTAFTARAMIVALATECERLQIFAETIRAHYANYPDAWIKLKQQATGFMQDPKLREAMGRKFGQCYQVATDGLDESTAQHVLDTARSMTKKMRGDDPLEGSERVH